MNTARWGHFFSAVYFTADTHFGHEKIIRYCKRPFHSAAEMDECIYANWATHVRPTDTVYHLGDVAFGDRDEVFRTVQRLRSLPGKKYLLRRVLPCAAPATG